MRTLMVSTNRHPQPMPVIPYGACLVAEAAEAAGHEVHFLDLMFQADPGGALRDAVTRARPEVVGLSVRNIDNNDMSHPREFIHEVAQLVRIVRDLSGAKVVLGGAALSILPGPILRATGADHAVTGDGDRVYPRLLEALMEGSDPCKVAGVVHPAQAAVLPADRVAPGGNRILAPDYGKWIRLEDYAAGFSPVPVKTQWGCPFQCVYCTYPVTEGREYLLVETRHVVESIRTLARRGVTDVEFVDNVFNAPYDHALEICRALTTAAWTPGIRFHTVDLNPAFVDDTLLGAMEAAGFASIGITADSAVEAVLEGLGKNYRVAHVEAAARAIRRHAIPCIWSFLLGGPGESRKTVLETLEFAREHIRPSDPVLFTLGIRIYPGTPLEALARKEGFLTRERDQMLEPVFYLSPQLDLPWLHAALGEAAARHLNFIIPSDFEIPLLKKIARLARWAGVKPPLWKHTRLIRRGLHLLGAK